MCNTNCPTRIHVRDGKAVQIELADQKTTPCPRWKAQLEVVYHPDRLQHPLKRTGERGSGSFARISWEEALDTIAANLQKVKNQCGPESVVFYTSCPMDTRRLLRRFTHAFGSPNYCTGTSSCASSMFLAGGLTFGRNNPMMGNESITTEPETRCKLIWGSAVLHSYPRYWGELQQARQNGMKLIVVDPRRTLIASQADVHLQLRPGTDGALALGMMNVIINEDLYDKEFTGKWTVGFGDLKKLVQAYSPEQVEQITRVQAQKIKEAARLYATCKPAKIHQSNMASTHHYNGLQNHRAILILAAITGNVEIAGSNRTAPHPQPANDITLAERVVEMPPGIGSLRFPLWVREQREMQSNAIADQIESGKPYPLKALVAAGLDIQFFSNSHRMVENLKKLDFISVNDYFTTPATQLADIVLPAASWLERPILVSNEGVYRLVEPAIAPAGESWTEWDIYSELAGRLGFGDLFWHGDFTKCIDYMLEPLNITCRDLRQHPEGIKCNLAPVPDKYYVNSGFLTPSGKVEIASSILAEYGYDPLPVYKEPPETPVSRPDLAERYPLVLTTGARTSSYFNSQHRNIPSLHKTMPDPLAEINPLDAAQRGIQSGDAVIISSPRGEIQMKASVTDKILAGVVSIPHLWPGTANAGLLVDDQNLDPITGFPPYKSQLCQVARYE